MIKKAKIQKGQSLNETEQGVPYVRVGCTYYKEIRKTDRHNIKRAELKVWKKEEIVGDYGKDYLKTIPHYDDFIMRPDNERFEPVVDGCVNLYSEFLHVPIPGKWVWT